MLTIFVTAFITVYIFYEYTAVSTVHVLLLISDYREYNFIRLAKNEGLAWLRD